MASAHYLIIAAFAIRASYAFGIPWPLPNLRWPPPEAARTRFEPQSYSPSDDLSARISNLQLLSPIYVSDLNKFKQRHPERAMLYEPMLPMVENPTEYSAEIEPMLPLVEKQPLAGKNSLFLAERNPVEKEPMLPLVERDRPLLTEKELMQPSWLKNFPLCCQKHRSLAQKQLLQQTPSQTLESLADNSKVAPIVEQVRPMLSEKELLQPSWLKKLPLCCQKHRSLAQKQLHLQHQSSNLEIPADESKVAPLVDRVRALLADKELMQHSMLQNFPLCCEKHRSLAQKQLLQPSSLNLESTADDSMAAPKLDVLIQYDDDDYDDDDFDDDDSKRTIQIIEDESSEETKSLKPIEPEIVKRTVSIQSTVNVTPEKNQDEVLERLRTVCAQFSMNVQQFSEKEPVGARLMPGLVAALCKILLKETGYVVPEIQETNMYRHRPLESWE